MRQRKSSLTFSAAVLLGAMVLRGVAMWAGSESLTEDPDSYGRLAVQWAESGTFGFGHNDGDVRPTAFRPPLYPWLLSWIVTQGAISELAVATLHLLLSGLSIALIFSISKSMGVPYAWLPAAAWACDPLLVRANQLVMTETLAACLVLVAWQLWLVLTADSRLDRASVVNEPGVDWFRLAVSLGLGLTFGLAILARPTAAPWAVLCGLALVVLPGQVRGVRLVTAGVVALGILACVLPWTIRNYQAFGKPIWATTHGGYTLLLANNPRIYEHFRRNGPSRGWAAEPFHQAWAARSSNANDAASRYQPTQEEYWFVDHSAPLADQTYAASDALNEIEDNELAYASAQASIRRAPGMFLISVVYRVGWFWALWPYVEDFTWTAAIIGAWYAVWFVLAIRSAISKSVRGQWRMWLPAILLGFSLTAVHGVYWSNMRMRGPLMSAIYVVAAMQLGARKPAAGMPSFA